MVQKAEGFLPDAINPQGILNLQIARLEFSIEGIQAVAGL